MAGMTTSLLLAGGAVSAGTSILGGNMQAKSIEQQADYNAKVYEQQAEMVTQKKKITDYQYGRAQGQMMGSIVSQTAGKGLTLSGSPMAILADTESQLKFDNAIADYNLDVERNYALSSAANERTRGANEAKEARFSGYSNAFSTLLSTGANIGTQKSLGGARGSGRTIYRPSYSPLRGNTYKSPYGNTYKY